MLRRFLIIFLLLSTLFTCSNPVLGGKNILSPTADLLKEGQGQAEIFFYRNQTSLELGLGFSRLSLGVLINLEGISQPAALFNVAILEEEASQPGLAAGAEIGLAGRHFYGVASKQLGFPGLRGHFTLGTGKYVRGMAGISLVLNPVKVKTKSGFVLPTATAVIEYDGQGLNGGLIAQFSPRLKVRLMLVNLREPGFGLSYKFF